MSPPTEAAAAASKPDARIRIAGEAWFGDDQYADDGFQGTNAPLPGPVTFEVRIENDGTKVDWFRIFSVNFRTAGPDT